MKKKIFIFCCFIYLFLSSNCFANDKKIINNLENTNFVSGGYLKFDLNTYKYNSLKDVYKIDVM